MCSQFWTLVCGCQEAPVHKPSLYSCTEVRGGRVSLLDHPSVQYHNVPLVENLISLSRLRVQSKLVQSPLQLSDNYDNNDLSANSTALRGGEGAVPGRGTEGERNTFPAGNRPYD